MAMKLLLENWRQYLTEEKDKSNSTFEEWHLEAFEGLKNDGYDPKEFKEKARVAYLGGATVADFEEEWLVSQGLLEQKGG
jgi:hypothetical protein